MKKKGDKETNCVPEDFKVEEYITDDTKKLENELKQKENKLKTKSRNRLKKCSKD